MKGRVVALDHLNGREAAALMVDGKLDDFLIEPGPGSGPVPGTIYRAICDRPLKGSGGMIVRLPGENGFLRQGKNLRPGQEILVQVTGFTEGDKAIPVTRKIVFKSRYVIVTPDAPGINMSRSIRDEEERLRLFEAVDTFAAAASKHGIIVRSQAENANDIDVAEDVDALLVVAGEVLASKPAGPELLRTGPCPHYLAWREWADPEQVLHKDGSFEQFGILDAIEDLVEPLVTLPGGASIYIEPTRALVAVDINTGSDTSPAAGIKANLACVRELPRQLRLRGLGGQITLDLAPMPKKDRQQFENALRSALRQDPVETALVGWTPLGHYELQRKRERVPVLLEPMK